MECIRVGSRGKKEEEKGRRAGDKKDDGASGFDRFRFGMSRTLGADGVLRLSFTLFPYGLNGLNLVWNVYTV